MSQQSLFGDAPAAPLPDVCRGKHQGNPRSEAANARVTPMKAGMREHIYKAIAASPSGMTLKELASRFDKQLNQISGRITELKKTGRIEETKAERKGCAVLLATPRGGE